MEHGSTASPTAFASNARAARVAAVRDGYDRGWSYTPLSGKRPTLRAWQSAPRPSLDQCVQWAAAGNVGLRCGPASGVVVIDIDTTDISLDQFPRTVTVITPGGGRHLYYLAPTTDCPGNSATAIRAALGVTTGVDVRGDGGQVVAVGCTHPNGGVYTYADGLSPADVPLAPFPNLAPAQPQPPSRPPPPPSRKAAWASAALAKELSAVRSAPEGNRNIQLNTSAFSLGQLIGGGHLDRFSTESALSDAAAACGLTNGEVHRTIRSGIEAGIRAPRKYVPATPQHPRDPATPLVLSPRRTLHTAIEYMRSFRTHDGLPTLVHYGGEFYAWDGGRYVAIEDGEIDKQLQTWLDSAVTVNPKTHETLPFPANSNTIASARDAIATHTALPTRARIPCWLDDPAGHPAEDLLCCRSCIVSLRDRSVRPATPALFNTAAIEFDYDPQAPPPLRWYGFLDSILGTDPDAIELIQQWFGYCLFPDTRHHKGLLIVGPKRAGKGTIAAVLQRLVGINNVAAPSAADMSSQFGLQSLVGRSLAIMPDARFKGEGSEVATERILQIIGRDPITVDRKFRDPVVLTLPTRILALTNIPPRFADVSGVAASRFVYIQLTQSFIDREDKSLIHALLAELPGILNWALEGYANLLSAGAFTQPASGKHLIDEAIELASPISSFVTRCCVTGPDHRIHCAELHHTYCEWLRSEGHVHTPPRNTFAAQLRSVVPSLRTIVAADNKRWFSGIAFVGDCETTNP